MASSNFVSGSVSRRTFLGTGAAVAAVSTFSTAQAAPPPALPAPIAALPVLSALPRPFTNAERLARIDRAKTLMSAAKIDAIVLANSTTSSVYFADLRLNGGERLWALVMPAKSKPFLVCPHFEEGRARETLKARSWLLARAWPIADLHREWLAWTRT